jgi:hypothetical protein
MKLLDIAFCNGELYGLSCSHLLYKLVIDLNKDNAAVVMSFVELNILMNQVIFYPRYILELGGKLAIATNVKAASSREARIFYIYIPIPHYLIFLASPAATSPPKILSCPATTGITRALIFIPFPSTIFFRLAYSTARHRPHSPIVPQEPPTHLASPPTRNSLTREGAADSAKPRAIPAKSSDSRPDRMLADLFRRSVAASRGQRLERELAGSTAWDGTGTP